MLERAGGVRLNRSPYQRVPETPSDVVSSRRRRLPNYGNPRRGKERGGVPVVGAVPTWELGRKSGTQVAFMGARPSSEGGPSTVGAPRLGGRRACVALSLSTSGACKTTVRLGSAPRPSITLDAHSFAPGPARSSSSPRSPVPRIHSPNAPVSSTSPAPRRPRARCRGRSPPPSRLPSK